MYTHSKKYYKQQGSALIIVVFFMLSFSTLLVVPLSLSVRSDTTVIRSAQESRQSLYLAESGIEDTALRFVEGMQVQSANVLSLGNSHTTTTVALVDAGSYELTAQTNNNRAVRKAQTLLITGSGASFFFGIQAGEGGIRLENSSSVAGNAYSNGSIVGTGLNLIRGSAVSAGPGGLVEDIHATSSVFAETIRDSQVDGDAYYQTIVNTTVAGTEFSGSVNQATSSFPLSDELITEWKDAAEAGGIISSPCPYQITGSTIIGPKKIACDLEVSGTNFTVTLSGPIWVEGDIEIQNSPTFKVDPLLGSQSVAVIADNESDHLTSSRIGISNSAFFEGSGSGNSYVLLLSMNESAEQGGSEKAIKVTNSADGDLLVYAEHGEIELANNISLKEVTAYRIRLKNSAEVVYETGLASLLFNSGPGGGYSVSDWSEIE